MRAYETNQNLLKTIQEKIAIVLRGNVVMLAQLLGKQLQFETDFGILKDNNEYIKVAKVLNPLGIGIVPYEYTYQSQKYANIDFKGFTDGTTSNIIYINKNIPVNHIQRAALHELIHVLKYCYYDVYCYLKEELKKENDFIAFCESLLNKKALADCLYPVEKYEDESIANFFTIFPENKEIPFAFFYKMYFKEKNLDLPTKPFNQQKYFYILYEAINRIS